jgi:hypothetical protein
MKKDCSPQNFCTFQADRRGAGDDHQIVSLFLFSSGHQKGSKNHKTYRKKIILFEAV